jgi:hypothetical protein
LDLQEIIEKFSEGLVYVDTHTETVTLNSRTKVPYLVGLKTMHEVDVVKEMVSWWKQKFPNDFTTSGNVKVSFPYPNSKKDFCDLVFSSDDNSLNNPEWAIEVKHISFLGDNGKNNDYNVQKMLSPYLKDRSLIHDIHKLKSNPIGRKQAVIGYCFNYDFLICDEASKIHPQHTQRVNEMRKVCKKNNDKSGELNVKEIVDFANQIFTTHNLAKNLKQVEFKGAWRHPCGGNGTIFAWEV